MSITAADAALNQPYRRAGVREVMPGTYFVRHPWSLDAWVKRWTDSKAHGAADLDSRELWLRRRAVRDPTLVPFLLKTRYHDSGGHPAEASDLMLLPVSTVLEALQHPPAYPARRRPGKLSDDDEGSPPFHSSTTPAPPAEAPPSILSGVPTPMLSVDALRLAVTEN